WVTGIGLAGGGVLWVVHGAFTMLEPRARRCCSLTPAVTRSWSTARASWPQRARSGRVPP
ncbi:MAG: hypothetical protein AVDCRST_MAG34-1804, partial [uncultured Nocardioidaceae bacterium]